MKITAEFNSVEEILVFANTFGTGETVLNIGTSPIKEVKKDIVKKVTPKEEKEEKDTQVEEEVSEVKDEVKEVKAKSKITKEEVRAAFGELIKAGKQKEAKEITQKYNATKVPEIKEEDYQAVMEDIKALLN